MENEKKRENAIDMIQGFRNYLHYHIKCTKSYLHSRMRQRVDNLLTGTLQQSRHYVELKKRRSIMNGLNLCSVESCTS